MGQLHFVAQFQDFFQKKKNNDIETIVTNVHKENIESNNLIANFGAKKELTSITPYNEYVLKLK